MEQDDRKKRYSEYTNNFIREHYDRILLQIPQGMKDKIQRRADELGMSMCSYIKKLVEDDIGRE